MKKLVNTILLQHGLFNSLSVNLGALLLMLSIASVAMIVPQQGQTADLKKPNIGTAVAGRNYLVLQEFGKTKVAPGKIEVTEFFWYGCPHCYKLEPYIRNWVKNKPSYVTFRRVPVPFNGLWRIHAQTYFTSERLGLVGKTHEAFFDAIHKDRQPLTNQRTIAKFFSEYGVSPDKFNEIFTSFGVESKLRIATREATFYQINSVPMVVVNGKYLVTFQYAGSEANMIEVIKQLTKLEYENPTDESNKPSS